MKTSPLLSIIIPTKNGQSTVVFSVDSALSIPSDNLEVIVQDCSDDDSLRQILKARYDCDDRLKYFYSDQKPTMNENWSAAVSNCQGKFIYGIGDDDAVLPVIIKVAEWMDSQNIEAVIPLKVQYIWNDAFGGTFISGRMRLPSNFTGRIFKVDLKNEFKRKVKSTGFGYSSNLPNIYHGFISKRILDYHKSKIGTYFKGTSMDVYSAFMIPHYLGHLYYIDYPISIWGASGKSNSNRLVSGRSQEHFNEFKNYERIEYLPKAYNAEVSTAETTIQALKDTQKIDLIQTMNMSLIYAKCASFEPQKFISYYTRYIAHKNSLDKRFDFFKALYKFMKVKIKQRVVNFIANLFYPMIPNAQYYIERITGNQMPICKDISGCIEYIKEYQEKHRKQIQFSGQISMLQSPKEIWE